MFLGASLDPDYFKSKVNLFVALGPATAMNTPDFTSDSSAIPNWPEVEYVAHKLGAYNLFNANWLEETAVQAFCAHFLDFCGKILHSIAGGNDQVDNMSRFTVFMKDYPAGSGYKCTIFYM